MKISWLEGSGGRFLRVILAAAGLAFASFTFSACGHSSEREVVVIDKTMSYHRPECAKTKMADIRTVDFTSAVKAAYKPCPYCKPDTNL